MMINIDALTKVNRLDDILKVKAELDTLKNYLPKEIPLEKLEEIINSFSKETKIGEIMKYLNSTYPNQFDKSIASQIINRR